MIPQSRKATSARTRTIAATLDRMRRGELTGLAARHALQQAAGIDQDQAAAFTRGGQPDLLEALL